MFESDKITRKIETNLKYIKISILYSEKII